MFNSNDKKDHKMILTSIYEQLQTIKPINAETFAENYLGTSKSYYRSVKCQNKQGSNISPSMGVLMNLMSKLHEEAIIHQSSDHELLKSKATKYDHLAELVGKEIITRTLMNTYEQSNWVKQTLHKIVNEINSKKTKTDSYDTPPILIGF